MSLKIFHFSDIHMTDNSGENPVCSRIDPIVAACRSNLLPDDTVLMVFSGDIACSGRKSEYKIFNKFLSEIVRKIKDDVPVQVDIICVPGNHDCNFGSEKDIEQRKETITSVVKSREFVNSSVIESLSEVQRDYNSFIANLPTKYTEFNDLVWSYKAKYSCGKVAIYMINTAWISQFKEDPTQRFFPINKLSDIDNFKDNLVITVFHHPAHWDIIENAHRFEQKIAEFSDLVLVGHEHINDSYETVREDCRYTLCEGTELQNPRSKSDNKISGFSVYELNDNLDSITKFRYFWNETEGRYSRENSDGVFSIFIKNSRTMPNTFSPNKNTLQWLEDIEIPIYRSGIENVKLSSLFVWHDLEAYEPEDYDDIYSSRIRENHYEKIITSSLTILIGESYCGKTTLAKGIYSAAMQDEKCCIYIDAEKISSFIEKSVENIIEREFEDQYDRKYVEEFQQLSRLHKVIIVDNFQNLKFKGEKKRHILKYLCAKFSSVVLFSSVIVDYDVLTADCKELDIRKLSAYKILPFGNIKRKELVSKWYALGESNNDDEKSKSINTTLSFIDSALGAYGGIIPAYPIHLITMLQTKDNQSNNLQYSQYASMYGALIELSLGKKLKPEQFNLSKVLLSEIAFYLLKNKQSDVSFSKIKELASFIEDKMLVDLNPYEFSESMTEAKVFVKDEDTYRFAYPYFYYYFAGWYIFKHINDDTVVKQIEYMSQRLYNDSYGNIIVFVCYFINDNNIIDDILLRAFDIYGEYTEFAFEKEPPSLINAISMINNSLDKSQVGTEESVETNCDSLLEQRDQRGINDGTVSEIVPSEIDGNEPSDDEKKIASLYEAFKIITVLGQIIKCYPAEIDGSRKIEIIKEIHSLAMRTANAWINIFELFEDDFIEHTIQLEKTNSPNSSNADIAEKIKSLYSLILAEFVIAMIFMTSQSLGGETSRKAAKAALESTISGQIALFNMELTVKDPPINRIIEFYKKMQSEKRGFACMTLRHLVANYLKLNKCGKAKRDQLCEVFKLNRIGMMLNNK